MVKKSCSVIIKIAVSVLLASVLIAVGVWGWHRYTDSPEHARAAYAHALVAGDVDAVRRISFDQASIDAALTNTSLATMVKRNEAITDVSATATGIRFTLAGQAHDIDLETVRSSTGWKVKTPTAALSLRGFPGLVAVNGVAVADRENIMLTPGIHELTSADNRLSWDPVKVIVVNPMTPLSVVLPQAKLTEAGIKAAREAVRSSLDSCLAVKGEPKKDCPLQPSDPPAMILDRASIELALTEEAPIEKMNFSLEEGHPWGWSDLVQLSLQVKGNVIRRNDLTQGTYQQKIIISVRARIEFLPDGKTIVMWRSV